MATEGKKRRPGRPRNPIARHTLLSLALQAFAERGYSGASMGDIASSAGLRKASLFHHFPSKDALYLEVLATVQAELGAQITEAKLLRGSFLERLDKLGTLAGSYLGANPGAAKVLLRELLDRGPYYQGAGAETVQVTLDSIAAFLQAGMFEGEIPAQDPHHLALSIASVHLTYFSVPHVCGELLEADIFDPEVNLARTEAVLEQVRRMCGAQQA